MVEGGPSYNVHGLTPHLDLQDKARYVTHLHLIQNYWVLCVLELHLELQDIARIMANVYLIWNY